LRKIKNNKGKFIAVILAGGRGMRFWPLSRKNAPKPLLCLLSEKPLICQACQIIEPIARCEQIFISSSKELFSLLQKALPQIPSQNFLLEPEPKDTAPAIGLALALISRGLNPKEPEPVLAFLPSDHYFKSPAQFRNTLKQAQEIAQKKDLILTIGVKPDFPCTGYGYIQPAKPLPRSKSAFWVKNFKEKPNLNKAQRYIKMGFYWNCGIFIARPKVLWKAFQSLAPELYERFQKIFQAKNSMLSSIIEKEFSHLHKISFDYAVMEKAENIAMVAGDFGWSDLGTYRAIARILGREPKNLGSGRIVHLASENVIAKTNKLTGLVGVKDLAIVETEDALLVMDLSKEDELKKLVLMIEQMGLKKYL